MMKKLFLGMVLVLLVTGITMVADYETCGRDTVYETALDMFNNCETGNVLKVTSSEDEQYFKLIDEKVVDGEKYVLFRSGKLNYNIMTESQYETFMLMWI